MYVNMHIVTQNTVDKEVCSTLAALPSQCGALRGVFALVSSCSLYSTERHHRGLSNGAEHHCALCYRRKSV
jgi:hypothetical protein